jgi:rRNA maturation RNase YbeY
LAIFFHDESIRSALQGKRALKSWLKEILRRENKKTGEINIIFTKDEYLRELNKRYLSRDYYTDVITFDYSRKNEISGDIYISLERVEENASKFNVPKGHEVMRVMVHGLLHLIGYKDHKEEETKEMRRMENRYLDLYKDCW